MTAKHLGEYKKVVENLLRDVNNNESLLKYPEDDEDILAEFGAFETGGFNFYWENENELDAAEHTTLISLKLDSDEKSSYTPFNDSVLEELAAQIRESTIKSSYADVGLTPATSFSPVEADWY
eukprot:snap_masked-scaffold_106-processed-gene-0.4-mRNA-1 protein AED:1.00 eAED:1.00 QI:0/0/0/0/1/1/3/0/122